MRRYSSSTAPPRHVESRVKTRLHSPTSGRSEDRANIVRNSPASDRSQDHTISARNTPRHANSLPPGWSGHRASVGRPRTQLTPSSPGRRWSNP